MPIDVHAHYVPRKILDTLEREGKRYGIDLVELPGICQRCLQFDYGLKIRPFFPGLVQTPAERIDAMHAMGVDRQLLSLWCDIFGYRLRGEQAIAWHRLMNDSLAELAHAHPEGFSWLASGPLPDAAAAARELERAVRSGGAVGAIIAANIDGVNLGDLPLHEYWAAAAELGVPIFIHPAQAVPLPRTEHHGLATTVQYTFDTTLAIGSLIGAGVLDRYPQLDFLLAHGGGLLPWLSGRFDIMYARMDHAQQHYVAKAPPSAYLRRLWYDTILHEAEALRYLARRVGVERLVLGTDDPFPPMDKDPLGSLRNAGFDAGGIARIADVNPRALFRRLS